MDADGVDAMLGAARADVVAARRARYRMLERVAAMAAAGVGTRVGYRDTVRVIGELWRVDPGEALRLMETANDVVGGVSLSGEPLPPAAARHR